MTEKLEKAAIKHAQEALESYQKYSWCDESDKKMFFNIVKWTFLRGANYALYEKFKLEKNSYNREEIK